MKKNILLLATVALALQARADNVLSDSFNYPDGPIVGAPGSPWLPNTGTANTMLATNSSLEVSTSRTEDIAAPLSRLVTNTVDVAAYASFSVRCLFLPDARWRLLCALHGGWKSWQSPWPGLRGDYECRRRQVSPRHRQHHGRYGNERAVAE
jgi:hypothetical protein